MNPVKTSRSDRFGLLRPGVEAHTLGINSVQQLLEQCGIAAVIADARICSAIDQPHLPPSVAMVEQWLRLHGITMLGFSYRLDPGQGADLFARWVHLFKEKQLLREQGGPLRGLFFAGLPETCELVRRRVPEVSGVFAGDETPSETMAILGMESSWAPADVSAGMAYDEALLAFGRDLVRRGGHLAVKPVDRSAYDGFGTKNDTLMARVADARKRGLPPLMRAHVGPFLPDRAEAVRLFIEWTENLAADGYLDVLSIGTSQLTQSNFGDDWGDRPNGGGVPINSPGEYEAVWQAARPMLVRTYAGTRDVPALAKIYENSIHIAWHALSLWWFGRLDGRGPNALDVNLREHVDALRFIASTGKPFEPNVPHHFSFRGADDVTCIVSAFLAAKLAKKLGVRHLVLQNMLNTPRYTWGVQDLAKARAMLALVRELEDDRFSVILQPRGGLDYFSHDLEKAKVQLAAVTALMDDIEPKDPQSPHLIHVVSYSEASHLADPPVINESIQITRFALTEYRRLRKKGDVDDMTGHAEVRLRMDDLLHQARTVVAAIESHVPDPYSAEGFYRIFADGFLPVPYLWECREEFPRAIQWRTKAIGGAVKVVDESGQVISAANRVRMIFEQNHPAKGF
ncbi:MAG: cobalamin-binding protein [Deltaproteobacteria bacterium]